jgi:guanine deaminase
VTIYAAHVVDTPGDPFAGDPAAALAEDGALLVCDGVIRARGSLATLRAGHPGEPVTRLDGGLLVPGFVDAHVHFPQIRAIGGLGMPLLDWLEKCALPEESKLADRAYARAVAAEFLDGLVASGTTSALVFGSHFAPAMDELFAAAARRGLNITSGLVLSDRILRPELLNSPETALADSADLILRWHDRGRLRYAVTPRFSLSASDDMLDACAQLLGKGVWFTSHINENLAEIATVAGLFPGARHYLDTYGRHHLITPRSVFAHNVHPGDAELAMLAEHGASVAHCPTSNCALGSGLFPLRRHVERGIGVALGSDVGAGAGLFLPKEALQAYFIQQLLGDGGLALTPAHLLYLATRAGAQALGLGGRVGDLAVGKDFDAVWLRPADGSTLAVNLRHARDTSDALARIFALATPADVAGVWIRGERATGSLDAEAGAVGAPAAVAGDVLVDAEVVLGLAEHHRERQLAVLEFDDGELELGRFGGQQRAQRAHGHVVQLAEDGLPALGGRVQGGELVADRVEPVQRRGAPLPDQGHAFDRVVRAPAAHPVPVEEHQGHHASVRHKIVCGYYPSAAI